MKYAALIVMLMTSPAHAGWFTEALDSISNAFSDPSPYENGPAPLGGAWNWENGMQRLDMQDEYRGTSYGWEHNGQTYETRRERDNARQYEDNH